MTESQIPISAAGENGTPAAATRTRRRAPARSKSAPRKKTATRRPATSTRRKTAAKPAARGRGELQGLLRSFASRASAARERLTSASGEGARFTRQTWQKVSGASRKTIDRLATEWRQMDSARKAQVLAALLSALAAASAPIVRRGLKKR